MLVELDHAILDLGDLDEPTRYRHVDQRPAAAPAVRVGRVISIGSRYNINAITNR